MDPVNILNDALAALNGILRIIAMLKAQGGMTDDQILSAAQAQISINTDQLKQLLANLPVAPSN